MKKNLLSMISILSLLSLIFISCNCKHNQVNSDKLKLEIINTEKEFEKSVKTDGISLAFFKFADDSAVILRNDTLIISKKAIKEYYDKRDLKNFELHWAPDFVNISSSGDLGYTYGNYVYLIKDSLGNIKELKGIFHTIWKKQSDGTWKYLWD